MAKFIPDAVLDVILERISEGTTLTVCSGQPTSYAGIASLALAEATLSPSDFTITNGDTSGRKVTVAQKSNLTIDASGDATHVSIDDGASLLLVTTCTTQSLTSGGTVTVPAFDAEISDPA